MSTAVPQSQATTVEHVEVTTPRVHNLHHVERPQVLDTEWSLDFFTRILGPCRTRCDGWSVNRRVLASGACTPATPHRVRPSRSPAYAWEMLGEPDELATCPRHPAGSGHQVERVPAGSERCQGDAIRFRTPAGHAMELFYEFDRCSPLNPSRLLNQPERYLATGVGVRRLDHINLTAADVDATRDWLAGELGFHLREAALNPARVRHRRPDPRERCRTLHRRHDARRDKAGYAAPCWASAPMAEGDPGRRRHVRRGGHRFEELVGRRRMQALTVDLSQPGGGARIQPPSGAPRHPRPRSASR